MTGGRRRKTVVNFGLRMKKKREALFILLCRAKAVSNPNKNF
jgi:hypothetical protein